MNTTNTNTYAAHILTAKINLSGIPKGSRLVYASAADDCLTYQHGSKAVVLSLQDATNTQYFEMAEPKAGSFTLDSASS
jgi:hypothetical protein